MKSKKLKIFFIVGEVSGDTLGSKIINELKSKVIFTGVGGAQMESTGAFKSLFPINDMAVMGVFDVARNIRTLLRRINETVAAIEREKPDIILSIDSPGFAKGVIKKIKKLKIKQPKFYHVVAPQIWVWGNPDRGHKYAKMFDRLYAFFDFEVPYFSKHGLETIPVGHPIADGLVGRRKVKTDGKTITMSPGSRMGEVKNLLPIYRQVAERLPKYKFYIPVVETTEKYVREHTADWLVRPTIVPSNKRYDLYAKTDIAIAKSGTTSAELAMMHVPAIVVFSLGHFQRWVLRQVMRIKYFSWINILFNKYVYPELVGPSCNADNIVREVKKLTPAARKKMIDELKRADEMWLRAGASPAKLIARDIIKNNK